MRVGLPLVLMCAVVCCREKTPQRAAETTQTERHPVPQADSVVRVRAAMALFRQQRGDSLIVYEYSEDSAGTLISLIPSCPPPGGCVGGGGLVRVLKNGKAQILNLYR